MPKVTAAIAALLLLFVLTGCGEETGSGDATVQRVVETPSPSPIEPTPEASEDVPLVAETTAPDDIDALYLAEARDRLAGLGSATTIASATDEQLIAAGHDACESLTAGTPFNDVTVIQGEQRVQGSYLDSAVIATAGMLHYCPEMNGNTN